jgi:hypothetical protein
MIEMSVLMSRQICVGGVYSAMDQSVKLEDVKFRGCDLTAECRLARANVRAQLPAAAPINLRFTICDFHLRGRSEIGCASARGRVSKTPLTWGGTKAACQIANRNSKIAIPTGPWQKSDAPALQAG